MYAHAVTVQTKSHILFVQALAFLCQQESQKTLTCSVVMLSQKATSKELLKQRCKSVWQRPTKARSFFKTQTKKKLD